jgi:glycosyltransferase involved in cell wall biosynthesis
MAPSVSILIPAFNAEKWIAQTLQSAVDQTWSKKEIIVVDDGSTDQTAEVARRFESARIKVVVQENQGAAAARNKALSLSQGDYVQWLDADDLLGPDKIAKQLEVASGLSGRVLFSSSFGAFFHRPSHARFSRSALWCDLSPTEFLIRKLGQKVHMQTAVWLVSRELTVAAGPWDTNMISDDDGEYFCRVLLASQGVRFVEQARVYYRSLGGATLSHVGRSNRKMDALWGSIQLHIRYLRSLEDSERVRASCVNYLQNYVFDFYPVRPDILAQMDQLAADLGGSLKPPKLSWKYSWIKALFGWDLAQRAQLVLPSVRWSVASTWDAFLFHLESKAGGYKWA